MSRLEINDYYLNIIKQGNFTDDYFNTVKMVKNSNAIFKGEPVPFLYHPMFFTEEDIRQFNYMTDMIISIGNKVINKYLESKEYRLKFNFSELLEKLILVNHKYRTYVPIGRFDIFYNEGDFKFCEFNTDGSSAMNEDNTLARILLETEPIKMMKEKFDLTYFEAIKSWVKETIDIYYEYSESNHKPTVAIVDFTESATTAEFIEFKKAYEENGYKAFICDIRELKYHDGKLYYMDNIIDLIYRRAVTREIIDRYNEIPDFIEAYINQAVCVIGSLKSQILHNKIIFKILHDEDTLQFLTPMEQEFIKKHVPLTKLFQGSMDTYDEVLKNKDKYIVKPLDLYGSRGVYAGLDYDEKTWGEILKKCFNNDYLYQEYFQPFTQNFVSYESNKFTVTPYKCLIGLFIFNEKFTGLYTRVGKNNIISELHGYHTIPNLLARGKK